MSILRNLVKNIGIKGLCFPAKSVYMDMPCEIIAGSVADAITERNRNNDNKMVGNKFEKYKIRNLRMCIKPNNKNAVEEIRLGTDRKKYNGNSGWMQSRIIAGKNRINGINEIEEDLRKRIEKIKQEANIS